MLEKIARRLISRSSDNLTKWERDCACALPQAVVQPVATTIFILSKTNVPAFLWYPQCMPLQRKGFGPLLAVGLFVYINPFLCGLPFIISIAITQANCMLDILRTVQ